MFNYMLSEEKFLLAAWRKSQNDQYPHRHQRSITKKDFKSTEEGEVRCESEVKKKKNFFRDRS